MDKGNIKYLYKTIKNKTKKSHSLIQNIIDENGKILSKEETYRKIREDYSKLHSDPQGKHKNEVIEFPTLPFIQHEEIANILQKISSGKALSYDSFPDTTAKLPKNKEKRLKKIQLIRGLWNSKFLNSDQADRIFIGRLFCISKSKGEIPTISQYRPIVALGTMFKILEKRCIDKLGKFVKDKCKISQTGFIPGCGTSINLMRVFDWTQKHKTNKSLLFFVDFRKAYDSVPLTKLFDVLSKTQALNQIELQFIKAMYQRIRIAINEDLDKLISVKRGLLQESGLSPLLFDIFLNELFKETEKAGFPSSTTVAYADDICFAAERMEELDKLIEITEDWSRRYAMRINPQKSAVMQLAYSKRSKRDLDPANQSSYKGYPVVDHYKYLGITLDYRIHLKQHLTEINQKVRRITNSIKIMGKSNFSPWKWIILYKLFVLPHILYSALATECRSQKNKTTMGILQAIMKTEFKRLMGLKKTTSDKAVQTLINFDLKNSRKSH